MLPGTAGWAQLCPAAQDEAAAVAREASQLAETVAELAAAQVCVADIYVTHGFRATTDQSGCQALGIAADVCMRTRMLRR